MKVTQRRIGIIMIVLCTSMIGHANVQLPAFFANNMVLQQNTRAPIWGKATPGATIEITASWDFSTSVICAENASWKAELETPSAGGPYTISIKDGDSVLLLENVLIGEVWLCSGQSNMEMPLSGWLPNDTIQYSETEIRNANYPEIRMFTVARHASIKPVDDVNGKWLECSPKTAPPFSATAFFFGKKLYQELNIPIGLIHSSWGGTPAEAWTSREYIAKMDDYHEALRKIDESLPALKKLSDWLVQFPTINTQELSGDNIWSQLEFQDSSCRRIDFDDSKWNIMNLPVLWEQTEMQEFDGAVWFRKTVSIPENWSGRDLEIQLGPIDDFDRTYVNGKLVGAIEEDGHYQTLRIYDIPAELNNQDTMIIAVRVNDNRGGGGIWGKAEQMNLVLKGTGESISIAGEWKYLPVAELRGVTYYIFGAEGEKYHDRPVLPIEESAYIPTTLYNGMIAPLVPYTIKGAIWYQGESNTGNPIQYETLFPLMITNWRNDWGYEFPFYYVQIAPYDYGEDTPSEFLRDAQRKTLSLANTGMAVTLDIGVNSNIHPPYKQEVGERLALWALAKQYDKAIVFSGPLYKSFKIEKKKIRVSFNYAEGLQFTSDKPEGFLIAGEDRVFYPAQVKIQNNELLVFSKIVKSPVAVRYAWSNTAKSSLMNGAGLPASSFRTDDWEISKSE